MIFPRFLCPFLLHSFRGCLGQRCWIPVGLLPSYIMAFMHCSWLCVTGDCCRAVLSHPHHRDEQFPPCWPQECLVAGVGQVAGLAAQVTPLMRMGLLCLMLPAGERSLL